jgi:hypothetical protein
MKEMNIITKQKIADDGRMQTGLPQSKWFDCFARRERGGLVIKGV